MDDTDPTVDSTLTTPAGTCKDAAHLGLVYGGWCNLCQAGYVGSYDREPVPEPISTDPVPVPPSAPIGPNAPAPGRNGRWVRLGDVGVDSASIAITDLVNRGTADASCKPNDPDARYAEKNSPWAGDWGTGIRFWAGFGDGGYDIWAWVVDYGEGDEVDERIAQVVVTMIDQADLDDWRDN